MSREINMMMDLQHRDFTFEYESAQIIIFALVGPPLPEFFTMKKLVERLWEGNF